MKASAGRVVLDHVTTHRLQFGMNIFGEIDSVCGTKACLAGWALILLGGCRLIGFETFVRPDGTQVRRNAAEAARLLELTDAEYTDGDTEGGLFFVFNDDAAIARFRELVEAAEREGA